LPQISFEVVAECPHTRARAGLLHTPHGTIETPVFMPVGTQATVKGLSQRDLADDLGVKILLANTYHLYLRPGHETIRKLGGLHRFMSWPNAILTDSGGYQVFSLSGMRKITDDGVVFRSHLDGDLHTFTPESTVDVQLAFGSDILMALDECPEYPVSREYARESMQRTVRWARQADTHYRRRIVESPTRHALFPIVQGSMYPDLRRECAAALADLELALQQPLPDRDRRRLEKELAQRRAGLKGEEEAAYHINFHLSNHPNWAVIHDLRIEWKGRTAQMDHLLISRMLEIYVVESKSFRTKVRCANGGWERLNFNHWEGIPCPVQQNARHIAVLKEMIGDLRLAPTRLGMSMPPTFYNIVVVQPSCSIIGKYTGDARIWRLDTLVKKVRDDDPAVMDVLKIISKETLHLFATKVAAYHKAAPAAKMRPPASSWNCSRCVQVVTESGAT